MISAYSNPFFTGQGKILIDVRVIGAEKNLTRVSPLAFNVRNY
jgi:hypothetical protein